MKLRSVVISLLFLCSTIAAFGQQGAPHGSWIGHMFGYGFVFQVAAVIHWSRKRPEAFWLWIIIIGGIIAQAAKESLTVMRSGTKRRSPCCAWRSAVPMQLIPQAGRCRATSLLHTTPQFREVDCFEGR